MTSFADLTIMQHFSGVFVFFLVFIIVYAFLQFTNMFKNTDGAKGIYAILSVIVAFIVSLSKGAFAVLTTMTPWFATLIIFLFLVMFVLKIFTGPDEDIFPKLIKEKPAVYWTLIGIFVIILIASFTPAINQERAEDNLQDSTTAERSSLSPDNGTAVHDTQSPEEGTVLYQRTGMFASDEEREPENIGDQILQTILHPQMLGVLLLIFIAGFAILFLTRSTGGY
ncbi:MAG: hypothetical protein ACQESE_01345 [Nanobdellota archaeon]